MLATFPLTLAQFQDSDVVKISEAGFYRRKPMRSDQTAGGQILKASLGDALWRGSFAFPPQSRVASNAQADRMKMAVLDDPGASFLVYDPTRTHPWTDPDGAILGAASPTIGALDSGDARSLTLAGLPANYQLTSGDYIGWTYGSSPTRYALHAVVSDVQADASGDTVAFEVSPTIRAGAVVGQAVTLIKPPMEAVMEPDPSYGMHRPVVTAGSSFGFVQKVR